MPDCHIEERLNTAPQDSLHRFLKIYIALEDKYINEFCNEKSADTYDDCAPFVYRFNYIYKDGSSDDRGTVFSSFDAIQKAINDPEEDVVSIKCTKMRIDEPNSRQIVYLTPKFEILSIDPGHIKDKHDYEIYRGVFDGLWFNFPTPFRKGDIVWDPKAPEGCCCGGPFVTTGVCLDGIVYPEVKDNLKKTEIPRICVPEGIS